MDRGKDEAKQNNVDVLLEQFLVHWVQLTSEQDHRLEEHEWHTAPGVRSTETTIAGLVKLQAKEVIINNSFSLLHIHGLSGRAQPWSSGKICGFCHSL